MTEAWKDATDKLVRAPKLPDIVLEIGEEPFTQRELVETTIDLLTERGVAQEEIERYRTRAMGGDFEHAAGVTALWITIK